MVGLASKHGCTGSFICFFAKRWSPQSDSVRFRVARTNLPELSWRHRHRTCPTLSAFKWGCLSDFKWDSRIASWNCEIIQNTYFHIWMDCCIEWISFSWSKISIGKLDGGPPSACTSEDSPLQISKAYDNIILDTTVKFRFHSPLFHC